MTTFRRHCEDLVALVDRKAGTAARRGEAARLLRSLQHRGQRQTARGLRYLLCKELGVCGPRSLRAE